MNALRPALLIAIVLAFAPGGPAHAGFAPVDDFETGPMAESGSTDIAVPIPGNWSHAISPDRELYMTPGAGTVTALLQPGLALNDHLYLYVTGSGALGRLRYSFSSPKDLTFAGTVQAIEMDVRGEPGSQITAMVTDGNTTIGPWKTLQTANVETLVWPVSQWVPGLITNATGLLFFFPDQSSDFAYEIYDIRLVTGGDPVDFVGAFVATQIPPIPSPPLWFDMFDAVTASPLFGANVAIASAMTDAQTVPAANWDWSWSSVGTTAAEMTFLWTEPGGVAETDFEISFDFTEVDGMLPEAYPPCPVFPPDPAEPESILLSFPVVVRDLLDVVQGVSDAWVSLDVHPDQGGSMILRNIAVTPNAPVSSAAGWTDGFTLSFRLEYSGMGTPDESSPLFTVTWRSDWSTQVPTASPTLPPSSHAEPVVLTAAPSVTNGGTTIRATRPLNRAGSVEIVDVTGRLVRSLPVRAGSDAVRWDGRGEDGTATAAGVYFLRLDGRPGPASRVVRVR